MLSRLKAPPLSHARNCTARVASGTVTLGEYDRFVLADDERDDGAILCCVAHVNTACVIEIPYDASEAGADAAAGQAAQTTS